MTSTDMREQFFSGRVNGYVELVIEDPCTCDDLERLFSELQGCACHLNQDLLYPTVSPDILSQLF